MEERSVIALGNLAAPSSRSTSPSNPRRRRSTFLLIDDDDDFRTALAQNLREDGHSVLEVASSAQLPPTDKLDNVVVLIAEDQGSGGPGFAYADEFHRVHAEVPVILLTAYRSEVLEQEAAARSFVRIVSKPVDYDRLHKLIADLVAMQP